MDTEQKAKEKMIALAEHTLHYTELLIKQCDSWLPEEEGRKNMEQRIMERQKKKKK